MCVCVCVCVRERDRERERESYDLTINVNNGDISNPLSKECCSWTIHGIPEAQLKLKITTVDVVSSSFEPECVSVCSDVTTTLVQRNGDGIVLREYIDTDCGG